jgi:predicted type IV restriction endonuclease
MQIRQHRFYETMTGKPETFASTARFTNVWLLESGLWKRTKSFSYDHQ